MSTLATPKLSPGRDHECVPVAEKDNLKLRIDVLREALADERFRLGLIELCRHDLILFIRLFGWQYNPKKIGDEFAPFLPWPKQDECLRWLVANVEEQSDGVIEKSREEGATWLVCWVQVWLTCFHTYKDCFNVSRNADAVDNKGNKFTIFAKIDHILNHLPEWLIPAKRRVRFLFEFAATNSQINGEATTDAAGVSGRASFALLDEVGQMPDANSVINFTADTCNARQFVSTHVGLGTPFHELTERARAGEIRHFLLHWSHNPSKNRGLYTVGPHGEFKPLDPTCVYPETFRPVLDGTPLGGPFPGVRSPWYDKECVRRGGNGSANVKLNLDIDVAGATSQWYPPTLLETLKKACKPPLWEGDLIVDAAGRPQTLVEQAGGPLQLWVLPGEDREGKLRHLPPARYAIGGDTSGGTGKTPSCGTVFDADSGKKVGRYTNAFVKPERFGEILVGLCRVFLDPAGSPAFLGWETPGVGSIMGRHIVQDLGYRHVYCMTTEFQGEVTESDTPGWVSTSGLARLDLHSHYLEYLSTRKFHNPCAEDLEECKAFVRAKGSVVNPKATQTDDPEKAGQNHSDHVIADAISAFMAYKRGWLSEEKEEEKKPPVVHPNSMLARHLAREREFAGRGRPSLWR